MSKKRTIRRPGGVKPVAVSSSSPTPEGADAVRQLGDTPRPPSPAASPTPRRRRGLVVREPAPEPQEPVPDTQPLRGLAALASMDRSELGAALLSRTQTRRLEVGAEVSGTVTAITRDTIFVDLGIKAEGQLRLEEWRDEVAVGDTVRAFVLSQGEAGVRLSTRLSGPGASAYFQEAFESQIPVEGQIVGSHQGGYDVRIGSARAFCPHSHIDTRPVEDPSELVGQTHTFQVIEVGDRVVLSRRRILEAEAEARVADFWATAKRGEVHDGVVVNVLNWGAFVDLNGVQGLVPRAELSWKPLDDATEAAHRGQRVRVQILDVDRDQQKLTLSVRETQPRETHEAGDLQSEGSASLGTFADLFAGFGEN